MIPVFIVLLFLGLSMEYKTEVLAGSLPKPLIWAEPSSFIAQHMPVTIWCQGSWDAQQYFLSKGGSIDPWDTQNPLKTKNKARFNIQYMTEQYAGIYKCSYMSPGGRSEHSDILKLVMIGAYAKPSLSIWPHHAVSSGVSLSMNCSSSLRFGMFILNKEGNHNLSWTLDSEEQAKHSIHAHFVLASVTTNYNGTFRCYGCFRNNPQVCSASSDPLDVLISESKDQFQTHSGNGLGRYQKVLIGVLVTLLFIFFLLFLHILFRYQRKRKEKNTAQGETNLHLLAGAPEPTPRDRLPQKRSNPDAAIKEEKQYASVKDTQPEESLELDSWKPPDEDPQRIVYAQVKHSRIQKTGFTSPSSLSGKVLDMKNGQSEENKEMHSKATTSKEPQEVTYAQLCSRTLK